MYKLIAKDLSDNLEKVTERAIDRTLSVGEASKILGLSKKTIYNRIEEIPHYKTGKQLRFSEMELHRWMRLQSL